MWIGLEGKKPLETVEELLIATGFPARQRAECPLRLVVLLPAGGLIGCFRPFAVVC